VNWSAPRLLAFAFVPMLVLTVMLLLVSSAIVEPSDT